TVLPLCPAKSARNLPSTDARSAAAVHATLGRSLSRGSHGRARSDLHCQESLPLSLRDAHTSHANHVNSFSIGWSRAAVGPTATHASWIRRTHGLIRFLVFTLKASQVTSCGLHNSLSR
ncbi:hypothetical protein PENTCL1PPCAC_14756, partial [Pristionchus entomophagus]